ncbi:MAG TPA: toll/interleukin-1 receptor domain-containing protein [Candidatus Binatia bacterium]|nr:toll/interleukin-1 receptor domain-containing protein [Candidatus Binatia bacterium]
MAEIFISYSQLDRERVKPIAERLASLGYSVWWDKPERVRQAFIDERERAFDAARAVLVVWSMNGRDAMETQADAAHALDCGKLLQLRIEPIAPPPPFEAIPVADMTGAGEWGPLEHAISRLVKSGESNPPAPRTRLGPAPVVAATGSPKLVAIAVTTVLAAFAGAVGASFNGVMTPSQLQIALVGMLAVAGACVGLSAHRLFTILRAAA